MATASFNRRLNRAGKSSLRRWVGVIAHEDERVASRCNAFLVRSKDEIVLLPVNHLVSIAAAFTIILSDNSRNSGSAASNPPFREKLLRL